MGTTFKIILFSKNKRKANIAAKEAFQKVEELNRMMSDYLADSEVSQLSKTSGNQKRIRVSKELYQVLKKSKKWSKKTNGSFDITVGPLSKLWRRAFRQQVFPDSSTIIDAKSKVNYRWIKFRPFSKKVKLKEENMRLDLGGIAKGYAVDQAMKILKGHGIKIALIDGGGDILVSDAPPNKKGWKITTLDSKDGLFFKNVAIATSGDHYQYLEWNDKRYGHIINPKTGYGVNHERQITVVAKTCTDADIIASACSILSKTEIGKLQKNKSWKITIH